MFYALLWVLFILAQIALGLYIDWRGFLLVAGLGWGSAFIWCAITPDKPR